MNQSINLSQWVSGVWVSCVIYFFLFFSLGVGDSGIFVDKTRYPTLTRFAYCQCHARQVISVIFRKFNWTEVILLVDTEHPQYQILGNSLRDGLQKEDIHPHFIDLKLQDDMDDKISYIRRHSRGRLPAVSPSRGQGDWVVFKANWKDQLHQETFQR